MSSLKEEKKNNSTIYNILLVAVAGGMIYLSFNPSLLGEFLSNKVMDKSYGALGLFLVALSLTIFLAYTKFQSQFKFIYSCFIKPLGKNSDQQSRLESFYKDQATIYDDTRSQLLRGRTTMLKLCASKLSEMKQEGLVWIDLGGGTGWNIEKMNSFFPIKNFDKVYLVDLTPSLCKVASERFKRNGWDNVHVVCADASNFILPQLNNPKQKIDLITMSYSLSMIDSFYPVIDNVNQLLSPNGFIGVCDFYTSGRVLPTTANDGGLVNRQCNWFTRWFWQIWFDFDHINLHPCRRDYLEYKFSTIKSFSGRNHFIVPYLVQIPYYIWLGSPKSSNFYSDSSVTPIPVLESADNSTKVEASKPAQLIETESKQSSALSFTKNRMPYNPTRPCHTQFDTYIYAFTWEDPREDIKVLDLNPEDEMFVITSAGDNALDYLCHADIKRIHCIDMNPHQNHLLELKIAGIKALGYNEFWKMFGEGTNENFENLLDLKLSAHMSSPAYQYWKLNTDRFTKNNFFKTGCSGYALNIVQFLIKCLGIKKQVDALCSAKTIEEQKRIYNQSIRPIILNSWFIKLLDNPVFLWKALGVPINQWNMLLNEGSSYQYMCDTLDPIISRSLFSNDQYFYHLCLKLQYTQDSCPSYVNQKYFQRLKSTNILDTMRLHTSSILEVLRSLEPSSLTKVILMDHMDWFNEKDAREEIQQLSVQVKKGGYVFWRSSARFPWYNKLFEEFNFSVSPMGIREQGSNIALDRVNMYASFYRAIKL
ncbi:hypothetical protein K502DRAFT_366453 [Neoconidiobolus thromboides FSU 785]|nr:hypothetical protein K502DRAFT_366453 [Neoconidiobolus thromboides FSU 785]